MECDNKKISFVYPFKRQLRDKNGDSESAHFIFILCRLICSGRFIFEQIHRSKISHANNDKMHSVGIHSALAIKRQRKRRDEQRRAKERRYSIQSSESGDTLHSPHGSTRRKFHHKHYASKSNTAMLESQVVTSIGMLHIGVVFIVFGVFLLGAGIIPDDTPSWNMFGSSSSWWNEVTCTGLFSTGLGIFLLVLNCLISKKEEEDLEDYVQRQLTRSRSGHRLERDAETGVLTTRHTRKALALKHDSFDNLSHSNVTPETSEMVTPTTPVGNCKVYPQKHIIKSKNFQ